MRSLIDRCKFADCTHRDEPACAVRAATSTGAVDPLRYASYLILLQELRSEPKDWE
jgi:ribosome biogenesis GTPase